MVFQMKFICLHSCIRCLKFTPLGGSRRNESWMYPSMSQLRAQVTTSTAISCRLSSPPCR